jgi:hypothetical protein
LRSAWKRARRTTERGSVSHPARRSPPLQPRLAHAVGDTSLHGGLRAERAPVLAGEGRPGPHCASLERIASGQDYYAWGPPGVTRQLALATV